MRSHFAGKSLGTSAKQFPTLLPGAAFNVSKKLGLISHPHYDFKAVLELTQKLKEFDINDPVKYDFALYRIGQEKIVI